MDEHEKNDCVADVGATHASPISRIDASRAEGAEGNVETIRATHASPLRPLPDGWRWVRLGELMPESVGSVDPAMCPEDEFVLYSIPAFDRGEPDIVLGKEIGSTKQVVFSGDVLLSKIVPHIRRTWVVGDERGKTIIASTEWIVFRTDAVFPDYLKYALTDEEFHRKFMDTTSGVGGSLLRARPALVAQIEVPLPPLSEQKRIAAVLTEQMTAVDRARAAALARLEAAKALPAAFLRQVFPQPGRDLPPGWRWVRLGEVCEQDRRIVEPNTDTAESLPYLSLEHIESNTGRILRQPSRIEEDEGKSTTFAFDSRHVLYGKLRPYLNKVALPECAGRCTTEIIPLLPKTATTREYLAWVLRRSETVEAAMRQKTGSRMPRASMDDLAALPIPLPPLSEQKRIAAMLTERMAAVDRARAAAEAELETINRLPAALLRRAFNGEL